MEGLPKTPKSLTLPWKSRFLLSLFSNTIDLVIRQDGTINRRLLNFIDFRIPPSPKPINGVRTHDVVVDPTRKLWFRVFVPIQQDEKQDIPLLVFFHGGGYALLAPDVKVYDDLCRRFAGELSAIVVSVDYRLAPEHRHPAQHDDGFDVLKFLDNEENRSKWLPVNANVARCFIGGDSAGGNLAHHVVQRACEFNFEQLKVIGLLAIQPFFGGQERTNSEIELEGTPVISTKRTDWFWNAFMPLGEGNNRDHPVINVSGPNAVDISRMNFPKTMVVVAGFDALREWQIRYYNWLKMSGKEAYLVQYPNMCHAFYILPQLPESEQFIRDVKEFIHKVLNSE